MCVFFFFRRRCLGGLPSLEYSGTIMAHRSLNLLGSSNPPISASLVVGTTGMHHSWLIKKKKFFFLVEMGSRHVGQAGRKLLTSGNPPTWTSQSVGIIGLSHHALPNTSVKPTCSDLDNHLLHFLYFLFPSSLTLSSLCPCLSSSDSPCQNHWGEVVSGRQGLECTFRRFLAGEMASLRPWWRTESH